MNKKVAGIIIVLVIIGAAWYAASAKPKTEPQNNQIPETNQIQTSAEEPSSIKDFLGLKANKICTFENESGKSTVYASSGKMRIDTQVLSQGAPLTMHVITDGQTAHTWTEGQTSGYKMTFSAFSQPNSQNKAGQSNVDLEKPIKPSCNDWTYDSKLFQLPSNIEFTDINSLVNNSANKPTTDTRPGAESNSPIDQSDPCNTLPEPAKAQCLAALSKTQ